MFLTSARAPVASRRASRGVTMLEVLIAIVILAIGLLGLASMQSRMQIAEFEAYQRAQAIVLLQDMVDRINANRTKKAVEKYVTANPLGTATTLDCTAAAPADPAEARAFMDMCDWSNALKGAAESGNVGAMAGGRGCITMPVTTMPREIEVAVVWQGMAPILAPGSTTCGQGLYGDERARRALIARIKIGCLQNDPTTGNCVTL